MCGLFTNLRTNLTPPSLPQRIRKRINQIHKPQSFEVEDGSPGPPHPPFSEKTRLHGEERTNPRPAPESPASQIVKYGGEAASPKSSSPFDVVELVFLPIRLSLFLLLVRIPVLCSVLARCSNGCRRYDKVALVARQEAC